MASNDKREDSPEVQLVSENFSLLKAKFEQSRNGEGETTSTEDVRSALNLPAGGVQKKKEELFNPSSNVLTSKENIVINTSPRSIPKFNFTPLPLFSLDLTSEDNELSLEKLPKSIIEPKRLFDEALSQYNHFLLFINNQGKELLEIQENGTNINARKAALKLEKLENVTQSTDFNKACITQAATLRKCNNLLVNASAGEGQKLRNEDISIFHRLQGNMFILSSFQYHEKQTVAEEIEFLCELPEGISDESQETQNSPKPIDSNTLERVVAIKDSQMDKLNFLIVGNDAQFLRHAVEEFPINLCPKVQPEDLQLPVEQTVDDTTATMIDDNPLDNDEGQIKIFSSTNTAQSEETNFPFHLDIDISEFRESGLLQEFLQELESLVGPSIIGNCLCVSAGSSILWIKYKNKKQLLRAVHTLIHKTTVEATAFKEKFKLKVEKIQEKFEKIKKNIKSNIQRSVATPIKEWIQKRTNTILPSIYESLKHTNSSYEVDDVMFFDVPKRRERFARHSNPEKSLLLFHGTDEKHFAKILQRGFKNLPGKSLGKWFGNGFYFTTFADYSLKYSNLHSGDTKVIMGCYVDVGNVREIHQKEKNLKIPDGFDCNHVRVYDWSKPMRVDVKKNLSVVNDCECGHPMEKTSIVKIRSRITLASFSVLCNVCREKIGEEENFYSCPRYEVNVPDHEKGFELCESCFNLRGEKLLANATTVSETPEQLYDEWAVKSSKRILPCVLIRFKQTKATFVWRNTTFDEFPNESIYKDIAENNLIFLCKDNLSALRVIAAKRNSNLYVISNGRDADFFVRQQLLEHFQIEPERILVFTANPRHLRDSLANTNVTVTGVPREVCNFVTNFGNQV